MIAGLVQRLDSQLRLEPAHAQFEQCALRTPGAARCRQLQNDALYAAATRALDPFVATTLGELRQLCEHDLPCIKRALTAELRDAATSTQTATALELMLAVDSDQAPVLPAALYARLADRTDLEAQLILGAHLASPLPDAMIAEQVADLALDPATTDRIRLSAVQALGHPAHVDALRRVVESFLSGEERLEVLGYEVLPEALSRCGEACLSELDSLAADVDSRARALAFRAVGRMQESLREKLSRRWLEGAKPGSASAMRAEMRAAESIFAND